MAEPVFSPVRLVDPTPMHAAVIWTAAPPELLAEVQEALRPVVLQEAEAAGLALTGRTMTVWNMQTPERIRIAPGVLVAQPFAAVGSLVHVPLPTGSSAHMRFEGPLEQMGAGWERLFLACHAQGWRPMGLNWEIYENENTDLPTAVDFYAELG